MVCFEIVYKQQMRDLLVGAWDKLYPSVLLKYHAMGFSARLNNLTQKESPCKIPVFTLIGPIFSLSSLVFTSSVILHVFMTDLMRCIRLLCIPCISNVLIAESNAFLTSDPTACRLSSSFGSVHLQVPFCQLTSCQHSP